MEKKKRDIFTEGAIDPMKIGESIAKHATQTGIGGHSLFLGQVRADVIGGKTVQAIEYTCYRDMALEQMHRIREDIFAKYPITCMHIHHSLGVVPAGGICLSVFVSSAHRKAAIDACEECVERIKKELPVWGRELFKDETHHWKVNQ